MNDIDLERAAFLMDVISKVSMVVPGYMALSGEAGLELKAMNDLALANQKERAAEQKVKDQEADAARLAAAQEQADLEAPPQSPKPTLKVQPIVGPDGEPIPAPVPADLPIAERRL